MTSGITVPKTHKAAIYDKPGSISTTIVDVETPEPGPGEVLINLYLTNLNMLLLS
jgi:propanol-preferring alcohol dehydrogenase